jgi:redox-sensitive bicupin YhaK (pirin superfamily)
MIEIRKSNERYASKRDWLDSKHTFGFGNVGESRFMGYRTLRILNEDKVAPSGGFGMHQHEDMEIVSYVLEGTVAHRDSLGCGGLIYPGEIQRMTAGSGIRHSEINASETDPAHFLQIWIQPCKKGLHPSYEQKPMPSVTSKAQLDLIGSHDGRDGSVLIHQDVNLYRATLRDGASLKVPIAAGRNAWVHVARGAAVINDLYIDVGDGAAVSSEAELTLVGRDDAELLVFDLR